jgi:serine protease Do
VLAGLLLAAPAVHAQDRTVPNTFADLAEKVLPAVVNISTVKKGEQPSTRAMPQLPEDSPFSDMLRRFWENQRRAQQQPTRALGSGFIIDPTGYIVTNNHVIQGADEITATLHDGRELRATLVGADRTTDLAVLKIEGTSPFPSVRFGDSNKTRVGDWVMAVGNPFGLGGTVTVGVLSARNRDLRGGPYDDYLQIDAPINRGNSGGPLFSLAGEVIGINTAIYSPSGGSVGIGFAIPSSMAARVIGQLRDQGKIVRGWLGVYVQAMNDDFAKAMGLDRARGALVAQVQEGSPAAKAGLKPGDVVLSVNEKAIEQSRDLARVIADLRPGDTAKLAIWRAKKEESVEVKLEELKSDDAGAGQTPRDRDRGAEREPAFGLTLGNLTDAARDAFNVPNTVEGALVAQVLAGSPAAEQGLQAGDVIVAIDGERVARAHAATQKLNAAKREGKPTVLMVSRQGVTRFVVLKSAT